MSDAPTSWGHWRAVSATLDQLIRDVQERNQVEQAIRRQIGALRQAECPWDVIGYALGISKQGAQQRYASTRTSTVDRPLPESS